MMNQKNSKMATLWSLIIFSSFLISLLPIIAVRSNTMNDHFFSSIHLFEHSFLSGRQFGTDIIDNVGPYGFFHYPRVFSGYFYWTKIAIYLAFIIFLSFLVTRIVLRMGHPIIQMLSLTMASLILLQINWPMFSYETLPRIILLLSAMELFQIFRTTKNYHRISFLLTCSLFFAFLTLEKSSNVYLIGLIVGAFFTKAAIEKKVLTPVIFTASFLFFFVSLWLLAGQKFSNLPSFFQSMYQFIAAYPDALVAPSTKGAPLQAFISVFFATLVLISRLLIAYFKRYGAAVLFDNIAIAAVTSALIYVVWKHGMTRDHYSHGIFFYSISVMILFLVSIPIRLSDSEKAIAPSFLGFNKASISQLTLLLVCSVSLFYFFSKYQKKDQFLGNINTEFSRRIEFLKKWNPAKDEIRFKKEYAALSLALRPPPAVQLAIGTNSIDEYGSCPEPILLANMNYRPRPVPIDFVAITEPLAKKNGDYYGDPQKAPQFVLTPNLGFRTADTLTYLSILFNYDYFADWNSAMVLKRHGTHAATTFQLLKKGVVESEIWIDLKGPNTNCLWLQATIPMNLWGKLYWFFYKPLKVEFEIKTEDGVMRRHPISLSALKTGFLLNPIIYSRQETTSTSLHASASPASRIRIIFPRKFLGMARDEVRYSLSTIHTNNWGPIPAQSLVFPKKLLVPGHF